MFNLQKAIIPTPQSVTDFGKTVKIGEISKPDFKFTYVGEGEVFESAVSIMENVFSEKAAAIKPCGKYEITLEICPIPELSGKAEGYVIEIGENKATLSACDAAGAYYAAATFEQILHTDGKDVLLPVCKIIDYPRFENRGHFMECRFGSDFLTFEDWKKGIDYLSKMKINRIIYGLYGCWGKQYDNNFSEYLYIPFKKHPQLKTPRNIKYYSAKEGKFIYKKDVLPTMFEYNYFGKLIEYGKARNVEVIPLFNSLGHNTLLPRMFPEISAVGEDGKNVGLGFCTNNPKTYEVMFSLYDEIIDTYLAPNGIKSFHIGLDEVWPLAGVDKTDERKTIEPFCKCEKCRDRNYGELMIQYVIKIAKHMKEKGIENLYIYHDMFLSRGVLTKETADLFKREGVYDMIIIDWWSYGMPGKNFNNGTSVNSYFRSVGKPITGYFHWDLPTQMSPNIYTITDISEKNNFEGVIAYSSFEYCYDLNYRVFAENAWRGGEAADLTELAERYAASFFPENTQSALKALSTALDFTLGRYSRTNYLISRFVFYAYCMFQADTEYPHDYPAKAYRLLRDEEDKYFPYLKATYNKALSSYEFFSKNTSSETGKIWELISLQYLSQADEYLTIYSSNNLYNKGIIDENHFISELDRLIENRKKTIALCEGVRIKANQYTCIRNMTIDLQAITDLRDYMKAEVKKGKKPEVDIFNFGKYLSDMSWFLR